MTHVALRDRIMDLCDVLQQLGQATPQGLCWCRSGKSTTGPAEHAALCIRTRGLLLTNQAHDDESCEPTPGYGFGV